MGVHSFGTFRLLLLLLFLSLPHSSLSTQISDSLIDIYPSVSVTSSSVLEDGGIRFVPQWAIDRVENRLWSNCFVSQKEINPWWRLDLGRREAISNVTIDMRQDDQNYQPEVQVGDMAGLEVYVSDTGRTTNKSEAGKCKAVRNGIEARRLEFKCEAPPTGRYVHVILPSTEPKHLALCEVFFNLKIGDGLKYSSLKTNVELVTIPKSEKAVAMNMLRNAFTDSKTKCGTTTSNTTLHSWIIYFNTPLVLGNTQVLLKGAKSAKYDVFAGSQLINDGTDFRQNVSSLNTNNDSLTIKEGKVSFVQYFKITATRPKKGFKLRVCELELPQNSSVLNIYSSSVATALNQLSSSNLPSKAIDKSLQLVSEACYRSEKKADSWWRLELPTITEVSDVVITTLPDESALSEMNGFTVHIGNTSSFSNSGRDNGQCGSPWTMPSSGTMSTIFVSCGKKISAKYVYIVVSNKLENPKPSLSLCEVQLYSGNCKGSGLTMRSTSGATTSIAIFKNATLSCTASGCPPPAIDWRSPGGQIMTSSQRIQNEESVTSSITVLGSEGGGIYKCSAYNGKRRKVAKDIAVSVELRVSVFPESVTVSYGQAAKFTCSAEGYAISPLLWESPTKAMFSLGSTTTESHRAFSTIDVKNTNGADGGGTFVCTATDGKGRQASAKTNLSVGPKIIEPITSSKITVFAGSEDTVECVAKGFPKPILVWKLQRSKTALTAKELPVDEFSSSYTTRSSFSLGIASLTQNGTVYTCEASNSGGAVSSSFTLNVAIDVTFTVQPKDAYGKVGATLNLSCEATGASAKYIKWYNNQTEIPQSDVHSTATSKKLTSTLMLSKVRLSQGSNEYHCKVGPSADLSNSVDSRKATVGILGSIHPLFENQHYHPGQSSNLNVCWFSANPRPESGRVTLDGRTVATLDKIFKPSPPSRWRVKLKRISFITAEDGGNYTCIGEMSSSVKINRTVQLGVTSVLSVKPQPIILASGITRTLVCKAKGYPVPSITWKRTIGKRTEKVNGNESVEYLKREKTSTLTFTGDSLNQAGSYQCNATNVMLDGFTTSKTFSVIVSVAPKIKKMSPKLHVSDGSKAAPVECIAEGYPKPAVIWKLKERGSTSLTMKELSSDDSASAYTTGDSLILGTVAFNQNGNVYTCEAKNSAGTVSSIFTLTVAIDVKFIVEPRDTYGKVGDNLNLLCEATGSSAKYLRWYKGNERLPSRSFSTSKKLSGTFKLTLSNVTLGDGSTQYHCRVGPTFDLSKYVSSRNATVGILGSISKTFQDRHYNPGQSSSSPLICSFTANPRPTGGKVTKAGNSSPLAATVRPSSPSYLWTVWSKPISSITAEEGGDYTCIGQMGPSVTVSRTVQLGIAAQISFLPRSIVLAAGGRKKSLVCKAKGYPIPSITWKKTIGRKTVNLFGKHRFDLIKRENSSTLFFTGDGLDQAGSYLCEASNVMSNRKVQTTNAPSLNVSVKPTIVTKSNSQTAEREKNIELKCEAKGYPLPAITWTFRGNQVRGSQSPQSDGVTVRSTLRRASVNALRDGGVYTCLASNAAGTSNSINLTLKFNIKVTIGPRSKFLEYGKVLKLYCKVTSFPALSSSVQWRKNTQLLPTAHSKDIPDRKNTSVTSTLLIQRANESHGGSYTCQGSPSGAEITIGNRFVVNPLDIKLVLGKSASLSCQVVGYPAGNVVWEVSPNQQRNFAAVKTTDRFQMKSQKTITSVTSTLNIADIKLSDTALYRCRTNGVQKKAISKTAFAFDVRFIVEPMDAFAKVGDKVTLSCEATGVSAKYISWYKDNKTIDPKHFVSIAKADSVISSLTLSNVKLTDGSKKYFCKVSSFSDFLHSVSSAPATIGILGSFLKAFRHRNFYPGRPHSIPVVCSFSANPRPTRGEVRLNGKTIASLEKTAKSSIPYWWTVWTKPIKSITAQDGGRYTCIGRMGPVLKISRTIQIGIAVAISVQPKPIILAPEETKILTCKAEGFPVPTITWIKKVGESPGVVTNNENIATRQQERTSSLIFVGNSLGQAGSYQCVAKNAMQDGTLSRKASSFVDVAAKPLILTRSSSKITKRKTFESLECLAIGYPMPAITWTFRGQYVTGARILSSGVNQSSTLTRKEVDAIKDGGDYRCSSSNSAGSANPMTVTLNFSPKVKTNPTSNIISYGGDLILSCQVTSYPAISLPIKWQKDGMLLPVSWSTDRINANSTAVNSTLRATSVKEEAGGSYNCHDSSEPAIINIDNYFIVNPQSKTTAEGNSATISCKVVGYPVADIAWEVSSDRESFSALQITGNFYQNFKRESRAIQSVLIIKEIRRNDSGYYRCKTSGLLRNISSREAHINVAYLDSITLRYSGKTPVRFGNTFSLSCVAVGNPIPDIVFYVTSVAGIPILENVGADQNHRVTLESNGRATLTVSNSQTSDSGYYFCRAMNLVGIVYSNAALIRMTLPFD